MSKRKQAPKKSVERIEQQSLLFRFANYGLLLGVMILDAAFNSTWDPPEYFYIVVLGVIVGADGKALIEKVQSRK